MDKQIIDIKKRRRKKLSPIFRLSLSEKRDKQNEKKNKEEHNNNKYCKRREKEKM